MNKIELIRLTGHEGDVVVAASPKLRIGASGARSSQDPETDVLLWNLDTGTMIGRLPASRAATTSLSFSRDGKYLAAGGGRVMVGHSWLCDASIQIWRTGSWRKIATFGRRQLAIKSVAFTPDGLALATESHERPPITYFKMLSWRLRTESNGIPAVMDASTMQLRILFGKASVYDRSSGRIITELSGDLQLIGCGKVSLSGKFIVTGSGTEVEPGHSVGSGLQVWNMEGKLLRDIEMPFEINSVDWLDDHAVFYGGARGQLGIWHWNVGDTTGNFDFPPREVRSPFDMESFFQERERRRKFE